MVERWRMKSAIFYLSAFMLKNHNTNQNIIFDKHSDCIRFHIEHNIQMKRKKIVVAQYDIEDCVTQNNKNEHKI